MNYYAKIIYHFLNSNIQKINKVNICFALYNKFYMLSKY